MTQTTNNADSAMTIVDIPEDTSGENQPLLSKTPTAQAVSLANGFSLSLLINRTFSFIWNDKKWCMAESLAFSNGVNSGITSYGLTSAIEKLIKTAIPAPIKIPLSIIFALTAYGCNHYLGRENTHAVFNMPKNNLVLLLRLAFLVFSLIAMAPVFYTNLAQAAGLSLLPRFITIYTAIVGLFVSSANYIISIEVNMQAIAQSIIDLLIYVKNQIQPSQQYKINLLIYSFDKFLKAHSEDELKEIFQNTIESLFQDKIQEEFNLEDLQKLTENEKSIFLTKLFDDKFIAEYKDSWMETIIKGFYTAAKLTLSTLLSIVGVAAIFPTAYKTGYQAAWKLIPIQAKSYPELQTTIKTVKAMGYTFASVAMGIRFPLYIRNNIRMINGIIDPIYDFLTNFKTNCRDLNKYKALVIVKNGVTDVLILGISALSTGSYTNTCLTGIDSHEFKAVLCYDLNNPNLKIDLCHDLKPVLKVIAPAGAFVGTIGPNGATLHQQVKTKTDSIFNRYTMFQDFKNEVKKNFSQKDFEPVIPEKERELIEHPIGSYADESRSHSMYLNVYDGV